MKFKMDEEKARGFLFKLKIFLWYICTEPYRQLRAIMSYVKFILIQLNKTLTWAYLTSLFIIISLLEGEKLTAALFMVFLLIILLLWEWQDGTYLYWHKQHRIKKYNKKKEEAEENELDNVCK